MSDPSALIGGMIGGFMGASLSIIGLRSAIAVRGRGNVQESPEDEEGSS